MAPKTEPWDAADYLDNEEVISYYLAEAKAENDPPFYEKALATVERARALNAKRKPEL